MSNLKLSFIIIILLISESLCPQPWTTTFVNTGGGTIYDLASNGSPQWIVQDPNTPDNIHLVIMSAPLNDTVVFSNRKTKYYFSSDRGMSWNFITNVNDLWSGFCSISVTSNGTAFICNNGSTATNSTYRVLLYQDVLPGIGQFTLIDPPLNTHTSLWGKFCLSSSIISPTKVILMANSDSSFKISGFPIWSSWSGFASTNPEGYSSARGQDGRIGITYIQNSSSVADYHSVYFIETTNNGVTFSAPLKIFQPVFSGSGADSLTAFMGISIAYKGNAPCITFETGKMDPPYTYYTKTPSKIRFWSSGLPGYDPFKSIVIADQSNVPVPSPDSIKVGNDAFLSISRPVIGVSSDNNSIFVVFQVFTNKWGGPVDTNNFKALYITKATNNYNFSKPFKFTLDSPLRDWSFPSLSVWNDRNSSALYANVCALSDSIPGCYPNSTNSGPSWAKLYFIRLRTNHTIGINENEQIVSKYALYQNYPNPFNPTTKIRFEIPLNKGGQRGLSTSLKVFDITGKEVAILVNKNLQPGTYEVTFDTRQPGLGSNIPSGVYFYKLMAGDYSETKRMIMIK